MKKRWEELYEYQSQQLNQIQQKMSTNAMNSAGFGP